MKLFGNDRWWVVWEWPRGGMAWWLWGEMMGIDSTVFRDWRAGPLTLTVKQKL